MGFAAVKGTKLPVRLELLGIRVRVFPTAVRVTVPRGVDEAEQGHPVRVLDVVAVVVPVPVAVIVAVPCSPTPTRFLVIMSASHALDLVAVLLVAEQLEVFLLVPVCRQWKALRNEQHEGFEDWYQISLEATHPSPTKKIQPPGSLL